MERHNNKVFLRYHPRAFSCKQGLHFAKSNAHTVLVP